MLLFVILVPYVIMPLFNKFEPVEENAIKADIEALAKECAYPLSKVEVVDGSKRSSHSNAFQYGIGSIKKVVIFDTLLEQHLGLTDAATESRRQAKKEKKLAANKVDPSEQVVKDGEQNKDAATVRQGDFKYENAAGRMQILGIVAHELGHWANMDFVKALTLSLLQIYLSFFAFSFSLNYTNMATDFGFAEQELGVTYASGHTRSVFLSLLLFSMVLKPIDYVLEIFSVYMVRRNEFGADTYSVQQGYGPPLRMGLIGVHVNNAANLNPDPVYAMLKFTHPALVERLAAIDRQMLIYVNEHLSGAGESREKLDASAPVQTILDRYTELWRERISSRHGEEACARQGDWVPYVKEADEDEDAAGVAVQEEDNLEGG